jgi:hypothetical protein
VQVSIEAWGEVVEFFKDAGERVLVFKACRFGDIMHRVVLRVNPDACVKITRGLKA